MDLSWLSNDAQYRLTQNIDFSLPSNYNFEILKILSALNKADARNVCLQFPEGLMTFSCTIALLIEEYGNKINNVIVIGDVTYGACCIEDLKAKYLNCDFLVHFGHSCLVPVDSCEVRCLYVFVEIDIDHQVLVDSIEECFPQMLNDTFVVEEKLSRVALQSTVQFSKVLFRAFKELRERDPMKLFFIPQCQPLTAGETLGCTSAKMDADICVFVSDGRFHIESAMINNPSVRFYRFDPFLKRMYTESYDREAMLQMRSKCMSLSRDYNNVILLLSTLGRQGSVGLAERAREWAESIGLPVKLFLINEIIPEIVRSLGKHIFVNLGCPRLSIDWGSEVMEHPFLSSYEFYNLVTKLKANEELLLENYEMDYFAANGGPWANYYENKSRNGSLVELKPPALSLKEKWELLRNKRATANTS